MGFFFFFFQDEKAKKNYLQAEYFEVVHGLIKGLNAPTRVTEEKQRPIGHVTTTPASDMDMGFLCRLRAEGFSGKVGIPEKIKIRSSGNCWKGWRWKVWSGIALEMRDGKEGCSSSENGGEKCQIPNLTFPHFSVLFYGNTSTLAFGGFSITVLFLYCGCFWLGNREGLSVF